MTIVSKSQIRAARAMLGWSQEDLAEHSMVSLPSIKRIEPGEGELNLRLSTLRKIQGAFEKAGIEFSDSPDFVGLRRKVGVHRHQQETER